MDAHPPQCLTREMGWEQGRDLPKVIQLIDIQIDGFAENIHNWIKCSIFCDLPYWKDQFLRHNLSVMHIEKIFCENIINTIMDVLGKTKDNANIRLDREKLCVRDELHLRTRKNKNSYKPKAKFSLSLQ